MKLLWLTDLHLDHVDETPRMAFYSAIASHGADAVVITGDISEALTLSSHLKELGRTFAPRPVYFVLGNHDFYDSSFDAVDRAVARVCKEQANLRHLGSGEIIPLGNGSALVGHRGWADGRAGRGSGSTIHNPDHDRIADLQGATKQATFGKMTALGRESGNYLRDVLPYALKCYEHVWVATHVPPFTRAAFYNGKPCGRRHLPHYSNLSAGCAIRGISKSFPKSRLTVLCGHTHSGAQVMVSEQVQVIAGEARKGWPQVQRVFDVSKMPIPV
ncbi:MAG: metallophosphoesterase family protein [Verrucomicrobia bacterium]|nr:metallophosphoesterase family protein [Verrucomicrobiota bacterium]